MNAPRTSFFEKQTCATPPSLSNRNSQTQGGMGGSGRLRWLMTTDGGVRIHRSVRRHALPKDRQWAKNVERAREDNYEEHRATRRPRGRGAGRKGDGAHSGCAAQWRQSPVRSETRAMATRRVARRCGLHMAISPQGAEHHAHEWHACSVVIAVHRAPVGDCQVLDRHNALHRSAAQQAAQASIATRVLHRLHALGWAERVRA